MPRIAVSYDQVAAVADGLLAENITVTNRKVLDLLGGGGGTIHKHLATWRNARQHITATASELPPEIASAINQEFNRAKAEGRAEIECRLVIIQSEANDLAEMLENMETDLDERKNELIEMNIQINTMKVNLQEQTLEIDRLTRDNERERLSADHAMTEVAQTRNKLDIQEGKLSELSATIEKQQTLIAAETMSKINAEKNEAVLIAKFEAEQQKSMALQSANEIITTQLNAERQSAEADRIEIAIKSNNLAQKNSEIKQLSELIETEKNTRLANEKTIEVFHEQLALSSKSAELMRIELAENKDTLDSLTTALAQKDRENKDLMEFYEKEKNARIEVEIKNVDLVARLDEKGKEISQIIISETVSAHTD